MRTPPVLTLQHLLDGVENTLDGNGLCSFSVGLVYVKLFWPVLLSGSFVDNCFRRVSQTDCHRFSARFLIERTLP